MKCPNPECGAEVGEKDSFCEKCGKALRPNVEVETKWKIIAVVLVLGAIVVGYLANANLNNSPSSPIIPRNGLIGEWHFDGDANDSSGNGNDGIIYGAKFVDGKRGKALHFNGLDNYVLIKESPGLDIRRYITLVAWINPGEAQYNSFPTLISKHKGVSPGAQYLLGLSTGKGISKMRFCSEPDFDCQVGNNLLTNNQWNFLAVIYNGSIVRYYINGNLDVEYYFNSPLSYYMSDVAIGSVPASGWFFNGLIDEVRIYNRALSEEEMKELMK